MKTPSISGNPDAEFSGVITANHGAKFTAVRDSRNRRIAALLTRNGRFYAQLWVADETGQKRVRKFPLRKEGGEACETVTEAKEALERLRLDARQKQLPVGGRKPKFGIYADVYLAKPEFLRKRPATIKNEKLYLAAWKKIIGTIPVDVIERHHTAPFIDRLLAAGRSARTANLYLNSLRNVLRAAEEDGYVRSVPKLRRITQLPPKKRRLITMDELTTLLNAAAATSKNGDLLSDYLRFLAFTGAREKEALRVRWEDVDFSAETVLIGWDGQTKNREARKVDLNSDLRQLLKEMVPRRDPSCSFLFPSPQRGKQDKHARTLRESLRLARAEAKIKDVGFHHLRVFFISWAVMAGIDFMTIARWVGHKDGGVLIGKVYGDLADEHRKRSAKKIRFGIQAKAPNRK